MIETVDSIAELVSLAETWPTLFSSALVFFWWKGLLKKAVLKNHRDWVGIDFFVLGICISYMGGFLDNLYWGVAWTCDFLMLEAKEFVFSRGVYSNIPFRQTAQTVSAYLHLRGIMIHLFWNPDDGENKIFWKQVRFLNNIILSSLFIGLAYIGILMVIRY